MRSNRKCPSDRIRLFRKAATALLVLLAIGFSAPGQTPQSPASPPPTAPTPVPSPAVTPPAAQPIASPSKPLIVIDAAHGGSESGAVLNPVILEKDVTLALARRLRLDLGARGIVAGLVRDGDITLSTDDRAAEVNAEHPVLYICLHATSEAGGIRIYSAMLNEVGENRGPFIDWNTAQSSSLANSRSAQQQLKAAIQKSGIPVRSLEIPLLPLNNVTSSAVAIEFAPTTADVSQLVSAEYQQTVSGTLADGIAGVISSLANSGASR